MIRNEKNFAFTLAEVLITLGIIGIVAAITIPGLLSQCKWIVLKNQYKKQYSVITQALQMASEPFDSVPSCYYWERSPYDGANCTKRDDTGDCIAWAMPDGNRLPGDYNGRFSDCKNLKKEMKKVLKIAQICENKSLEKGCIPPYKGNDTVYKENQKDKNPSDYDINKATSSQRRWREASIHNNQESWVLMDGTIILFYSDFQMFAIDINGKKGPNKWGHDLFSFTSVSNGLYPIVIRPNYGPVEKGGKSGPEMKKGLFKK